MPDSSVGKESTCNVGDLSSITGLGRSPGEGKSYPLQYSGLENPMDTVHESWIWLSDFHLAVLTEHTGNEEETLETSRQHSYYVRLS